MVAILVWNRPSSAGTGATGAPQAVHVVHASAGPGHANAASLPTNVGMGYAAILKPALSAVVNISSSRVVKAPQGLPFEFFNDPFSNNSSATSFMGSASHAEYERIVRETAKQELGLLVNRGGQTSFMVLEPE